jgi:hypothetical protein
MRKIILTHLLLVLSLTLFAAPEMVSTISFNPSRLGNYTYLKINKDINLKGGLRVSDQTHFETPASDTGELTFAAANGGTINITATSSGIGLEIPNLTSKSNANSGVNINMPSAVFQQSSTAPVPQVEMTGGSMLMGSTTEASTITTLTNAAGGMVLKATETLRSNGNIVISGDTSAGGNSGMTLGKVLVPKPSIAFNKYCWKNMKGASGTLKVFALCTASDSTSDYVQNQATPTYSWKRTGSSSASVNTSESGNFATNKVNYWMTQYGAEKREGSEGSTMWVGHGDELSSMLSGTLNGRDAQLICKDVFGSSVQVVTSEPADTCSKDAVKVYVTSSANSFRRSVSCMKYTCK